jgi:putative tricarboxylic transport membrane protein
MATNNDGWLFVTEFFTTPLSTIILAAVVFTLVSQTQWWKRLRGLT